jgi:CubicO group peptidase (beta-lactamase class C family)
MRARLADCHQRSYDPPHELTFRAHVYKPAREDLKEVFHSAGGGLFTTAEEYCAILAALLNDGVSPTTGHRILKNETIDEMFTNQLPDWQGKYAAKGIPIPRPALAQKFLEGGIPVTGPQGWGLNFLLVGDKRHEVKTGKGVQFNRGGAPGLANCYWGKDTEKGVGGVIFSQILPFGDPVVFPLWERAQVLMYGEA